MSCRFHHLVFGENPNTLDQIDESERTHHCRDDSHPQSQTVLAKSREHRACLSNGPIAEKSGKKNMTPFFP